jgi:hypothetical protein
MRCIDIGIFGKAIFPFLFNELPAEQKVPEKLEGAALWYRSKAGRR